MKICYPWLDTIYNQILHSYCIKKGHHALLLDNKFDNGEDILINYIVRWLVCTNPCNMEYCDICENCYLMNIGEHPNYYLLDLKENIQFKGVDFIRMFIDSIYKCIRYSSVKVIFIKNVEFLTNESINVLLKIIEEPPQNTYFFFTTRDYMKIPMTLLSRCIKWSISPPVESIGLKWLIKDSKLDNILFIKTALRLCCGSPIEAKSMLKLNSWNYRSELCNIINQSIKDKDFLKLLTPLTTNKCNNISIYWLITLLLDALKWRQKIKEEFIINLDQLKLISTMSLRWDILSLNDQLRQWWILFHYFQKFDNINRTLLLTYRLLNWEQNIVESCFQPWSV